LKTDHWFYALFQRAPDLIALLLPAAGAAGASAVPSLWPDSPGDALYHFDAPELKAANHRLDGAFWPRLGDKGTPEQPVVLLEVQMHAKPWPSVSNIYSSSESSGDVTCTSGIAVTMGLMVFWNGQRDAKPFAGRAQIPYPASDRGGRLSMRQGRWTPPQTPDTPVLRCNTGMVFRICRDQWWHQA